MERLYTSRKLWGALLGSISSIIIIMITSDAVLPTALMYNGALWGAAIGGQAISDAIKKNNARK